MTSIILEEYELLGDAKYRGYMSQVDKALKAFEYTTEWADLIAALKKLNNVLLAHMKYPIIPRRVVISKRLAQCMHPALPSGVHLKALDTYDIIFKCMGTNRLAQELFLYSAGLFPLLGHAAMNVRPTLLTVYETHFVPLGERLRPALNGLLAGVLLGLEEGADHYERTNRLLESVCEAVEPLSFYGSLWECVATNPAIRLSAVNYVLKHFDRKISISENSRLFGSDPEVIVKAVCATLLDSSVLVQRSALDFLALAFPMHIEVIKFSHEDLVEVVSAATSVLLRRDMSLNRRLYSWLCGNHESKTSTTTGENKKSRERNISETSIDEDVSIYFNHYSKNLLVEAIKKILLRSLEDNQPLKPYRLVMTLLDKPEVGNVILEHVIIDVFRALFHSMSDVKAASSNKGHQELIKSANLLFGTLESSFIWEFCGKTFEKASCQRFRINDNEINAVNDVASQETTVIEMCALVDFLLDVVSIETYVETASEHLPNLFKSIVNVLTSKVRDLTAFEITQALKLAKKLLSKVQPAWNAWDVEAASNEVGKEATESLSPPSDVADNTTATAELGVDVLVVTKSFEKQENNVMPPRDFHEILMRDCIDAYQDFYVTFLKTKAFHEFDMKECLGKLIKRPQDTLEERTKYLEHLLKGQDHSQQQHYGTEDEEPDNEDHVAVLLQQLKLQNGLHKFTPALKLSCEILVELSSIPTMGSPCSSSIGDDYSLLSFGCSPQDLPVWLKHLIISACYVNGQDHPDFLLESINTLLEIISLLDSNLKSVKINTSAEAGNEANFIIVMMPLITESQYKCILKQTLIPQIMTSKLWGALGYMPATYHLQCVCLMHQLHNLVPRPKVIETIIAKDLNNVSTYQRFTLLWHLSRDLETKEHSRTFDTCLLKMLDNLNMTSGPLKVLSQSWLVHAMTRGDVGRIMEPLFLTLLDPCTARVSVLHCNLEVLDDGVFVIHAEKDVIFHVINNKDKSMSILQYNKKIDKQAFVDGKKKVKAKAISDLGAINLEINPFALVPHHVEDYHNYTKGYNRADSSSDSSRTPSESSSMMSISESAIGHDIVTSILDELLDIVITTAESEVDKVDTPGVHALHSHLLLYTQVSDSRQVLYTLECLKNILTANARLAICALSTTHLNSKPSPRSHQVQILLARHRKSVFGKGFVGELTNENLATHRNSTLIEVLISTALYYLRSYYPHLPHLSSDDVLANREVQLMAIDLLIVLVSELILVVKDNSKAYAIYINDLFSRCKVQKVVLHSLIATVHDMQKRNELANSFTEDILRFNEVYVTMNERVSNFSEAFQVQILKLLLALVMLEQVVMHKGTTSKVSNSNTSASSSSNTTNSKILRYLNDHPIPDQPMFLASIVSALKLEEMRHLHSHWTSLITNCMPFLDHSLTSTVLEVTGQLALNLERMAPFYFEDKVADLFSVPADYVITQLEALTMMYHFCLIEDQGTTAKVSAVSLPTQVVNPSSLSQSHGGQQSEILSNLLHVFLSNSDAKALMASSMESSSSLESARKSLLGTLPRLIACASVLWGAIDKAKENKSCILVGAPKVVRTRLLDLLSPICHHHSMAFLAAIGITWQEKRSPGQFGLIKQPLPQSNEDQQVLVDMVSAIKTLPVSIVIQTLRQVLKSPPIVSGTQINVEVAVLQFFYAYLAKCSVSQVMDLWSDLAGLLRECLVLAPPAIFLALAILNQFTTRAPTLSERKDQKELQELAGKLVDSCAQVGGSCLEQTSWIRSSKAVKAELQIETEEDLDPNDASTKLSDLIDVNTETSSTTSGEGAPQKKSLTQYAVPALSLLGSLLAPLLDIIYSSDEKDKVVPLLSNVMINVVPYLKNHSRSNLAFYRACSRLLASLSEYQNTRKAWKKEAMELLIDPVFFQIDLTSLRHWKTTVDNLMTHDKTTFKDLMTKVASISQSGSLSLFSSKDLELEQRALLLKRLAFVIFCSDMDQYQKQMPEIQERLAESLRTIPTSPAVQSAVFLCFRVILIRMSPQHVTSLWPLIITEMVQIFSYLEQELSTDSEEWSSHLKRLSTLDSSWVVSAGYNGLAAHNSPSWLGLYLSVCKLLDLSLALPAQHLPQFQMYQWAFVSEGNENNNVADASVSSAAGTNGMQFYQDFVPYVVRVAKLLLSKTDNVKPMNLKEGEPQLTMTSIYSLDDLAPFFAAICQGVTRQQTKGQGRLRRQSSRVVIHDSNADLIDSLIERDFLETVSKQ